MGYHRDAGETLVMFLTFAQYGKGLSTPSPPPPTSRPVYACVLRGACPKVTRRRHVTWGY